MSNIPIYYGYNGSPFVAKLEAMLLLKNIPARRVDVPMMPPRPELATLLGLPYRRVPVLALGRDLYVDTALIARTLERRFPPSLGHPSLFPPPATAPSQGGPAPSGGTALQSALVQFYADKTLFEVAFGLMPWTKLPAEIQADRKEFIGRDVDFAALAKELAAFQSTLVAHLALYEQQLADGRAWMLDTATPGLVDISLHTMLAWCRTFRATRPVFDPARFPLTVAWLDRMDALLAQKRRATPPPLTKISGAAAAAETLAAAPLAPLPPAAFDAVEAARLGLRLGARIAVRPNDTGKDVETLGTAVAFSSEETVLELATGLRVHFPRLGYAVRDAGAAPARL